MIAQRLASPGCQQQFLAVELAYYPAAGLKCIQNCLTEQTARMRSALAPVQTGGDSSGRYARCPRTGGNSAWPRRHQRRGWRSMGCRWQGRCALPLSRWAGRAPCSRTEEFRWSRATRSCDSACTRRLWGSWGSLPANWRRPVLISRFSTATTLITSFL